MYKVANRIILIQESVNIKIELNKIIIEGKEGNLILNFPEKEIKILLEKNEIKTISEKNMILAGTYNSIISNAIKGVEKKFEKKLKLIGSGYKIIKKESNLELYLGKSHTDIIKIPEDLEILIIGTDTINILGIDKQRTNFFAQMIKNLRKPNPYKKKGIYFLEENIKLKERKKV